MMKKLLGGLLGLLFILNASAVVIQGEVSPGVYTNFKSDSLGNLNQVNVLVFTSTAPVVTNTSTVILAANTARKFLIVQNNDTAGIIYINWGGTATVSNLKIAPGTSLFLDQAVSNASINAIGSIASNANVVIVEGQ